ncbi:conserved hypothetical protein [uncultured Desulfobacterium sp.]|uniref:Ner winged helix-turn-helix DNA-binding domain-containing protein n=1 Tax=uncultured Desulfobacterium sp. TaxID=201089 RepID=A0A445MW69_9BACT|nr:conserved hypothetical protein [uncultured Desulfobacterium sp.]
MDPLDIKHAIERAGSSQSEIARERGVTPAMVNRVIWNGDVSDHIRRAIARRIGRPVEDIWPAYYLRKFSNG